MRRRTFLAAAPAAALAARTAEAASATHVTLWHAMGGQLGQTLQGIVDHFNKSQSAYAIDAVYKGSYPEVLTATIAAWRAGKAPSIAQVFDVGTADMLAAGKAVLDVWKLSEKSGIKIDAAKYIPAVRGYYGVSGGRMGGQPFNSSTAVLWLNNEAFEKAGLDPSKPPQTWPEVVDAARTIKAKKAAEIPVMSAWPTWVHFEQFSAIHNVEFATLGDGFNGWKPKLMVDSAPFVKNLQTLLTMQKEGLFQYEGRDGKPSPIFYAGKAAMHFDSSAIFGQLQKSAKFKATPAFLPYHPSIIKKPINSIIGGAAFWAMTAPHRTDAEYRAVAAFFNFLAEPANDAHWAEATGYVPVTHGGSDVMKKQGFYAKDPGTAVAVEQLTRTQPTQFSRGIRLGGMPEIRVILEEEWERAIQSGASAQDALAKAQPRGQAVIDRFARTIRS